MVGDGLERGFGASGKGFLWAALSQSPIHLNHVTSRTSLQTMFMYYNRTVKPSTPSPALYCRSWPLPSHLLCRVCLYCGAAMSNVQMSPYKLMSQDCQIGRGQTMKQALLALSIFGRLRHAAPHPPGPAFIIYFIHSICFFIFFSEKA